MQRKAQIKKIDLQSAWVFKGGFHAHNICYKYQKLSTKLAHSLSYLEGISMAPFSVHNYMVHLTKAWI